MSGLSSGRTWAAGTFLEKLAGQLVGAPRETILFAAELVYLQQLPIADTGAPHKRNQVMAVLNLGSGVDAIPRTWMPPLTAASPLTALRRCTFGAT